MWGTDTDLSRIGKREAKKLNKKRKEKKRRKKKKRKRMTETKSKFCSMQNLG
jgi:hypothetical protein